MILSPTPHSTLGEKSRHVTKRRHTDSRTDQNGQMTTPVTSSYLDRLVTDGTDEHAWLQARARGITATDVAKLTSIHSIPVVALEKLRPSTFTGNAFTEHGKAREPIIAEWVRDRTGIEPSSSLFHSEPDTRHLATPDGIGMRSDGVLELAEIKTTGKGWDQIPGNYLRQVYWQQYVLGAQRTFFVWEQHRNFIPIAEQPQSTWIERDDDAIAELVWLANGLIGELHRLTN
jgi:predicted phage-related endonuclease